MQNGTVASHPVQNGAVTNGTAGPDSIHFTTKSKMPGGGLGLDSDMRADVDARKGKNALIIWRDNKGDMEPVPEKEYGKFYSGDCYVIYNAHKADKCSKLVVHIHFLIGYDTEGQDEQMDVAIFATQLDDYLGGGAVQFREDALSSYGIFGTRESRFEMSHKIMGEESAEFKAIFNGRRAPNLRYAKGGHASRMKKVDGANKTQLYELKGARIVHAVEIEVKVANMNSDDCYVLDGGSKLFVITGKDSNNYERRKAIMLARSIRDNEQAGKGQVVVIGENELTIHPDRDEIRRLFQLPANTKFTFGNLKKLRESDIEAEKKALAETKLYKISDKEGDGVEIKELGPPEQSLLNENDSFILLTGKNVYVWKGRKASSTEKAQAITTAKSFLKKLGKSPNLGIVVMPQFGETAAFRTCFPSWRDDSESKEIVDFSKPVGYGKNVGRSVHTVIDFRRLHEKPKGFVVDDPYDDDDGKSKTLSIYHIDQVKNDKDGEDDKTLVECGRDLVFNSSESYVIVYEYGNRKCVIYYWLGNDCSQIKKGSAAEIAKNIDEKDYGGLAVQERVIEGKEPPHFMRMFNKCIIVKQKRFEGNEEHMYHVRAQKDHGVRVVEVGVDASNLNSNDCFILDLKKELFLWYGKRSTGDERRVAQEAAAKLNPKCGASGQFNAEGEEQNDFWKAIGGRKDYDRDNIRKDPESLTEHEPRLFHCYNNRGSLEVEEVYDFDQDDLIPDDVFFLDTYYRLYIWVGKGARRDEREDTIKFVRQFIEEDPSPRTDMETNISILAQGAEPRCFKKYFGVWEDDRTETMTAEEFNRLAMDRDEVSLQREEEVPEGIYTLAELQVSADELPYGLNVEKREMYLKDDEFQEVFKMCKEDYMKLPKWKRENLRKENKLF